MRFDRFSGTMLLALTVVFFRSAGAQEKSQLVAGIGMGAALTSFSGGYGTEENVTVTPGLGFKIGKALNDRWDLYFSSLLSPTGYKLGTYVKEYGLFGITVRHRLGGETPSWFFFVGGDLGLWHEGHEFNYHYNIGPRGGIGYEINPHLNIEGTFSWIPAGHNNIGAVSTWLMLNAEI